MESGVILKIEKCVQSFIWIIELCLIMKLVLWSKTNKDKSTEMFPPLLLLKPTDTYMHTSNAPRAQADQQKVSILKKTIGLEVIALWLHWDGSPAYDGVAWVEGASSLRLLHHPTHCVQHSSSFITFSDALNVL